jgi:hypothetical protein
MKASMVVGGAAVAVFAVGVYFVPKPPAESPPMPVTSSPGDIPRPEYFLAHPDLLKSAERRCQHNTDPSSLYCTNVQRAESLRLAEQYRQADQPKGSAQ